MVGFLGLVGGGGGQAYLVLNVPPQDDALRGAGVPVADILVDDSEIKLELTLLKAPLGCIAWWSKKGESGL